jgi:hypothetical protein
VQDWLVTLAVVLRLLDGHGVAVSSLVDPRVGSFSPARRGAFEDFGDARGVFAFKNVGGKMPPGLLPGGGRC